MDIEDWRRQIDKVDLEVLRLLNERAQYSINIGEIKHQGQLPIYSPVREAAIIKRVTRQNSGPLTEEGVRRIFERIIDESRKLEKDVCKNLNDRSD